MKVMKANQSKHITYRMYLIYSDIVTPYHTCYNSTLIISKNISADVSKKRLDEW